MKTWAITTKFGNILFSLLPLFLLEISRMSAFIRWITKKITDKHQLRFSDLSEVTSCKRRKTRDWFSGNTIPCLPIFFLCFQIWSRYLQLFDTTISSGRKSTTWGCIYGSILSLTPQAVFMFWSITTSFRNRTSPFELSENKFRRISLKYSCVQST